MAILRHEQEDGTAHFDLLIATSALSDPDAASVPTYRVSRRPDLLRAQTCVGIEPAPLHRERYLTLTQSVVLDQGRGSVTPLRHGRATPNASGEVEILWKDGSSQTLRIARDGAEWTLTVVRCGNEKASP
ncbi:MAG: hypothetical protein EXS10_07010 [Phycisphaerales bacterium]|nr:hypothetical protein [Phycisphaerales bacterium]